MAKKKSVTSRSRHQAENAKTVQSRNNKAAKVAGVGEINVRLRILQSREAMLETSVINPAVTVSDLSVGSFFVLPKITDARE